MALMAVKIIPVIDGCGGQFMSLMAVEVCIYAKDGCRGLYMAFIIVEFNICY